jgi:hypothetical protein
VPNITRSDVISAAKNLPQLVQMAETYDPALAKRLSGSSVLGSGTIWGTIGTLVVSQLAMQFGLGWPPETSQLVGGALTTGVAMLLHWVYHGPLAPQAPVEVPPAVASTLGTGPEAQPAAAPAPPKAGG